MFAGNRHGALAAALCTPAHTLMWSSRFLRLPVAHRRHVNVCETLVFFFLWSIPVPRECRHYNIVVRQKWVGATGVIGSVYGRPGGRSHSHTRTHTHIQHRFHGFIHNIIINIWQATGAFLLFICPTTMIIIIFRSPYNFVQ